jgi:hypothetical protein
MNYILPVDGGHTWIPNYLIESATSEIRMLPSFDAKGNIEAPLDPNFDPEDIRELALGQAFCLEVVGALWNRGRIMFLDTPSGDKEGRPCQERRSPLALFCNRLGYKTYEQELLREAGRQTHVPKRWMVWRKERMLNSPMELIFIQCMALRIQGQTVANMEGKPSLAGPSIFAFPKSAANAFLQNITSRVDASEDLSLTNNLFGDFYSPKKGRTLLFQKIVAKEKIDYQIMAREPYPIAEEECRRLWKPWNQIFRYLTIEEIIGILLNVFDEASIDYAFRDTGYADYIPEAIRGTSSEIPDACDKDELQALKAMREEKPQQAPLREEPARKPSLRPAEEDSRNLSEDELLEAGSSGSTKSEASSFTRTQKPGAFGRRPVREVSEDPTPDTQPERYADTLKRIRQRETK